jgi:hypothetical protein
VGEGRGAGGKWEHAVAACGGGMFMPESKQNQAGRGNNRPPGRRIGTAAAPCRLAHNRRTQLDAATPVLGLVDPRAVGCVGHAEEGRAPGVGITADLIGHDAPQERRTALALVHCIAHRVEQARVVGCDGPPHLKVE